MSLKHFHLSYLSETRYLRTQQAEKILSQCQLPKMKVETFRGESIVLDSRELNFSGLKNRKESCQIRPIPESSSEVDQVLAKHFFSRTKFWKLRIQLRKRTMSCSSLALFFGKVPKTFKFFLKKLISPG
jgi:hypothetical protein